MSKTKTPKSDNSQTAQSLDNKAILKKGGEKNIFGQSETGQAHIDKESLSQKPRREKLKG